jgi:hypothetical protein
MKYHSLKIEILRGKTLDELKKGLDANWIEWLDQWKIEGDSVLAPWDEIPADKIKLPRILAERITEHLLPEYGPAAVERVRNQMTSGNLGLTMFLNPHMLKMSIRYANTPNINAEVRKVLEAGDIDDDLIVEQVETSLRAKNDMPKHITSRDIRRVISEVRKQMGIYL